MTSSFVFRPFLRTILATAALGVALSGCAGMAKKSAGKDVEQVLAEMKGPEIPGMNDALLNGAKQAEASNNYSNAAQFYQQLVEKNPTNKEYQFNYAESLRRAGKYTDAVAVYEKLKDDEKYALDAKEGMGLSLMAEGEFDKAGDQLADVMAKDTTRWRTINAIGILFTIKQMYPEARQYFAEALVQAPDSVAVRNNMGLMEALDKKYDEAERLLKEASKVAGKDEKQRMQADMNLALVYAIDDKLDMSKATAKPYLTETQLLNNMGYYAYLADDEQMAKSYLNMALTSSDKYYDKAWQNLETLNKLITSAPAKKKS